MSDKPRALSTVPPAQPAEPDYDSICSAVTATARGRWFLDEYTRRNRNTGQAGAAAQPDIAGAAERLRDIAWTMRACGVEPGTSEQIEQIAETILSASSLRDPGDHRTQKLGEVLHYLEHRIDRMLDSHMDAAGVVVEDTGVTPAQPPPADGHDRDAEVAAMEAASIADAAPEIEVAPFADAALEPAPLADAGPEVGVTSQAATADTTADIETAVAPAAAEAVPPSTGDSTAGEVAPASPPFAISPETSSTVAAEPIVALEPEGAIGPVPQDILALLAKLELAIAPAPEPEAVAAPVDEYSAAQPVAAAEADIVAVQVDQDLQALTEFLPVTGAPDAPEAPDVIALPTDEPPAAAPVPEPPPESDALANAWEPAILTPPVFPGKSANQPPLPSMWVQPVQGHLRHDDAPAAIVPDVRVPAATAMPSPGRPTTKPMPRHAAGNPLAALTAMTDEERIALFT